MVGEGHQECERWWERDIGSVSGGRGRDIGSVSGGERGEGTMSVQQ